MAAATILFMDIVGFSKKPTSEQQRFVNGLNAEVMHELRTLLNPPLDSPSILAMPTGDGMALAFVHKPSQVWDRSTILRLVQRLHEWAQRENVSHPSVSLRMGVHVGPVEIITDINGRPNVCGHTINFAQRVMDAANPRQTLFSEAAYREYIGNESSTCCDPPFSQEMKAEFQGPIEVYAKHDVQVMVYKLTVQPAQAWCSNEDPVAKHMLLVSLTPLPKEIVGTFSENLEQATRVAFVQLTGDRFLNRFQNGEVRFSPSLKRLWVFMPDPAAFATLVLSPTQPTTETLTECVEGWKKLFTILATKHPEADFKLGLFRDPPYFGASFLDWERPGGKIHVSPYVWGVGAPDCPGYDLQWIARQPSPVYEVYLQGLRYLHSKTENAVTR